MTARQFAKGDTVRVLTTFPDESLHGREGKVLGYSSEFHPYANVDFPYLAVQLLHDHELELVQ